MKNGKQNNMTNYELINATMRPEDTPRQQSLQDALRDAAGLDDDSEFVVATPPGWTEPKIIIVDVPDMPDAIARFNERNAAYMCGAGNTHCGKTFGRIVQSWRNMAHEDAKAARVRGDHMGEMVQLALMWAGNDD